MSSTKSIEEIIAARVRINEARAQRITRAYQELRTINFELYKECVASASAISLNQAMIIDMTSEQQLKLGADIEASMVDLVLRVLDQCSK